MATMQKAQGATTAKAGRHLTRKIHKPESANPKGTTGTFAGVRGQDFPRKV